MKLYSLFYAQEFNIDEGEGAAVYHGTFSTPELARVCAVNMMKHDREEVEQDCDSVEEVKMLLECKYILPTTDIWVDHWYDEGEWQIVEVTLDIPNTGAHLL